MDKRVTCQCGHEIAVQPDSTATSLDCPACGREVKLPGAASREPAPGPVLTSDRQPCPYCLEKVRPGARKCPFCQEYLDRSLIAAPPPAARAESKGTSGLAAAALVLGVVAPMTCFLTALPAVLLGLAGIAATSGGRRQGRGMAIGGLLLGLLWIAACIGLLVLMATTFDGAPIDLKPPANDYLF